MEYVLREAMIDDAEALGAMHVAAWRETYFPHILSAASFEVATPEARGKRWREILSSQHPGHNWLAERAGRVLGFAAAGAPHDPEAPRPLELYSIYILAETYGTGLGQHLIDLAIADSPASVWVAEDNPRAHAFYRRNGFVADGSHKVEPFILDEVAEIRMLRG